LHDIVSPWLAEMAFLAIGMALFVILYQDNIPCTLAPLAPWQQMQREYGRMSLALLYAKVEHAKVERPVCI